MIAIGSPLTKALGMAGRDGSHAVAQLPVAGSIFCGAVSQSSAGFDGALAAAAGWAGTPAAGADHVRASSSLACAAARSAVNLSNSAC